jgi:hypothetical protein
MGAGRARTVHEEAPIPNSFSKKEAGLDADVQLQFQVYHKPRRRRRDRITPRIII